MRFHLLLLLFFLAGGALVSLGSEAEAHQTDASMHMTEVRADTGEVEQLLSISAEDLGFQLGLVGHHEMPSPDQLAANQNAIEDYINRHTMVRGDDGECELKESRFIGLPGPDGRVHLHQLWACPTETRRLILGNQALFSMPGGYRHTARIQLGEEIFPTVFDANFPTYTAELENLAAGAVEERKEEQEAGEEAAEPLRRPLLVTIMLVTLLLFALHLVRRKFHR